MFGYIKIDKYELKYKDIIKYKNIYCSVCNSLKDNIGLKGCLLTSYDAALFLAIFDGIDSSAKEKYTITCPLNPLKIQKPVIEISTTAFNYTAYISAFYTFTKLKDNIQDENTLRDKLKYKNYLKNKRFQDLLSSNPQLTNTLNECVGDYYTAENSDNKDFDELSNLMGILFGKAFEGYANILKNNNIAKLLYDIGFDIGKWIYLADAFDDLKEDKNKHRFNPLLLINSEEDKKLCERVIFMSRYLTQKINFLTNQLDIQSNKEIIENIISTGMNNSIIQIAKNKYNYA